MPLKSIERKIARAVERVGRLKEISKRVTSLSEYQASSDAKDIVERNLQVAIEACLDIGKIVIVQKKLREPKDNKGVFLVLAECGIVSKETAAFLIPMAGTRNVLVHGYDKIEDEQIYAVLKKRLNDFTRYLQEIRDNFILPLSERAGENS